MWLGSTQNGNRHSLLSTRSHLLWCGGRCSKTHHRIWTTRRLTSKLGGLLGVVVSDAGWLCRSDPTNTNVYIGNISPELTEADIRRHFSSYGHVVDIKLHKKGGYGFVRYQKHSDAVNAILQTRGQTLTGKVMKCSWGKHPDIPTGRSMVMALQAPLAPLSPLGSGEQVVQSLLPAQYGMAVSACPFGFA